MARSTTPTFVCEFEVKATSGLLEAQRLAALRGGHCLSAHYVNSGSHLEWACAKGHQWPASLHNVKSGTWCPTCSLEVRAAKRRSDIEQIRMLAEERGGELLSETYPGNKAKLLWRCADGHEWQMRSNNVVSGQWCPVCAKTHTREERVRFLFRKLFPGESFDRQHKDSGIPSPHGTGRFLSLDGYSKALGLAFEYQGIQHYDALPYFGGDAKLAYLKRNDEAKRAYCSGHGIALVEVPYWIEDDALEVFIRERCEARGFPATKGERLDRPQGWRGGRDLRALQALAKARGGTLLDEVFLGGKHPLRWRCAEGHEWKAAPSNVNHRQSWCPKCADILNGQNRRTPVEELDLLAKARGGKCLRASEDGRKKAKWRCGEGHEWEAPPSSVKLGHWCVTCAGLARLNLASMRELAGLRGGQCLSIAYVNIGTKLLWRCEVGHEWKASPSSVKHNGSWCPFCAGNKVADGLAVMQALARNRGGECLSKVYAGVKGKLRWRCAQGHEWEATAGNVKHRHSWCPECWKLGVHPPTRTVRTRKVA